MGHSSTRAALIYLHSTGERHGPWPTHSGDLAQAELKKVKATGSPSRRSGTDVARRRKEAS